MSSRPTTGSSSRCRMGPGRISNGDEKPLKPAGCGGPQRLLDPERSPGELFPDSAIQSVPHGLSITKRQLPSS
jgi:hypothetical protein